MITNALPTMKIKQTINNRMMYQINCMINNSFIYNGNNCTIIRGYDKAFTYIESWLYKIYWHIKYQLYNTQQHDDECFIPAMKLMLIDRWLRIEWTTWWLKMSPWEI